MKKRVISILAALLCMATLLSACGKSSDGQSTDNAEGKKEITVAIYKDGAMEELDAATYNGPHFLYKMIYEGFVEDNRDGTLTPVSHKLGYFRRRQDLHLPSAAGCKVFRRN